MRITVDRTTLEKLLHHATFAAHLVGHFDDGAHPDLICQLGDHIDAVAHELTELLGDPRTLAAPDAVVPNDRAAHDGTPMLTASVGGAS
jgi:hypothetical protein